MIFTALSPASTALSSARGLRRQQRQARRPAAAARPCAAATPGPQEEVQESQQLFENLATELERSTRMMLARYDFLSAGLGALAVSGRAALCCTLRPLRCTLASPRQSGPRSWDLEEARPPRQSGSGPLSKHAASLSLVIALPPSMGEHHALSPPCAQVTTFCVARGQDPQTALWITFASTVVALVGRAAPGFFCHPSCLRALPPGHKPWLPESVLLDGVRPAGARAQQRRRAGSGRRVSAQAVQMAQL